MPFREVDIHYEFPAGEADRYQLIDQHAMEGRLWLSTAVIDGRMRMRFGRFESYAETVPDPVIDTRPYKTREDIGLLRKNQRKIPKASDKIGYSGRNGSDRPEWDR